ncbi:hypothetical protein F5887DRAFT_921577 [Amanita rubescens]|nr:hypothetical protein F5887DRAFT_921577 [Amanita rubescens]
MAVLVTFLNGRAASTSGVDAMTPSTPSLEPVERRRQSSRHKLPSAAFLPRKWRAVLPPLLAPLVRARVVSKRAPIKLHRGQRSGKREREGKWSFRDLRDDNAQRPPIFTTDPIYVPARQLHKCNQFNYGSNLRSTASWTGNWTFKCQGHYDYGSSCAAAEETLSQDRAFGLVMLSQGL